MLAVLVVVLAVLVPYVQALGGPLVWDDRLLILEAPPHGTTALGDYLSRPFWSGAGAQPINASYYRPVVTLSFALDQALHGTNAGGFHLTNVVLHLTNALLLFAVLRKFQVGAAVAAIVAVAWALQPRLAEAAAWISGRTDLLAATFALAALLVWGRGSSRRISAAALMFLGLLAKEAAIGALPALLVYEWRLASAETTRPRVRELLIALVPLAAASAGYLALRVAAVGIHVEGERLGVLGRSAAVLQAVGTYAAMMVDAWRPRAVIGRVGAPSLSASISGFVLVCGGLVLLSRHGRRMGVGAAVGITLAFFSLAPVLHVVPIPLRTFAADRFLYLPSAGLAIAAAGAIDRALASERARWLGAVVVVGSLAIATFRRVAVWSDEVEFWTTTYLETPRANNAAATELAGVFYRAGMMLEALAMAERALGYDDPNKRDARYNSALCLKRLGRTDEALRRLLETKGRRHDAASNRLVALIHLQSGAFGSARALLERQVREGDSDSRALLVRLPKLETAHRELVLLGPAGDAVRRAQLATELGDELRAKSAWRDVVAGRAASQSTLAGGLRYLVQTDDVATMIAAARDHAARFGPDPVLFDIVELRLAELERLRAVLPRLDLTSRQR
jgi:protein O-mannosyl-transferase